MKIAMICPSNMLFMPYVENYKSILKQNNIQYLIINWDRFHIEKEQEKGTFRDNKLGHQRSFLDYYKYKNFVIHNLKENKYDKVIVFGVQLAFFLKNYLLKHYKENYLIDIRDHNKIIDLFKMNKLIKESSLTVISSPGYTQFLPHDKEYIINHNTDAELVSNVNHNECIFDRKKIRISYIGALRDFEINISLINALQNHSRIELYYHGEGEINQLLKDYIQKENINNVFITGRYPKNQEELLYKNSDFVNVLRFSDGINNITALPNRLYLSVKYRKPLFAFEGSYLAEQIKKYRLGLVINSFEDLPETFEKYIKHFDEEMYEKGMISFSEKVTADNTIFRNRIKSFCMQDYKI
jgi:hypothetical protein